jgi:hypothetical protein
MEVLIHQKAESQMRGESEEEAAKSAAAAAFKPLQAPSRTERMLLCQQMARHCAAIDATTTSALPKLFALDAFARGGVVAVDDDKGAK